MKFRPLHDRVVVRRIEQDERTSGGIIIPDTAQEKPMEGEVIAVGPGGRTDDGKPIPMDVKAGDRVKTDRRDALRFLSSRLRRALHPCCRHIQQ